MAEKKKVKFQFLNGYVGELNEDIAKRLEKKEEGYIVTDSPKKAKDESTK